MVEDWLALNSKDALDELAESEDSRLLAVPLLFGPFAATQGTTRLPSPSRTIGMNLSLGEDDDEVTAVGAIVAVVDLLHVMDEEGELLPGVDG